MNVRTASSGAFRAAGTDPIHRPSEGVEVSTLRFASRHPDDAKDMVRVIVDRMTGKTPRAQIFVAAMTASNPNHCEGSRGDTTVRRDQANRSPVRVPPETTVARQGNRHRRRNR
jgi:hypothetical protein